MVVAPAVKALLSDPAEKLTVFAPVGLTKNDKLSEEQIWYHLINSTVFFNIPVAD